MRMFQMSFREKCQKKCKDPGMFTIPCNIGNMKIEKAMIDLGASISVMPTSIYHSLGAGHLKETNVIIQLADRSNAYSDGVLEDVLVQVNDLIFPADFYVLDMEDDSSSSSNPAPILLGKPFLKTVGAKIDVSKGVLTMEFDGEQILFNIYDSMKYPSEINPVFVVDVVDDLTEKMHKLDAEDKLATTISESFCRDELQIMEEEIHVPEDLKETIYEMESLRSLNNVSFIDLPTTESKLLPSIL